MKRTPPVCPHLLGLYITAIVLLARTCRIIFRNHMKIIMFDDMPNVDRVLQLCLDIYLVRENKNLVLEEDLFGKLIFFFRSPETMILWTRPFGENHRFWEQTTSTGTELQKKSSEIKAPVTDK